MNKPSPQRTGLRHEIRAGVDAIPRAEWERLFGDRAEGYDYHRTLEASRLPGFGFAHACILEGDRLVLIAPLFWGDLDLVIGTEGGAGRVIAWIRRRVPRFLVERTLFCGSPFGEEGAIGIDAAFRGAPEPLLARLAEAMDEVCRERRLRFMVFKDFPAGSVAGELAPLKRLGFMVGGSFPNVVVDLPYRDMDGYLASLGYGTRKDLRRKVRKALAAGRLETRVVGSVDDVIDEVMRLYRLTFDAGTVRFETLTREYFLEVGRTMAPDATYFLFYLDGRLICFNLCFRHGDDLIDKFIGMDYAAASGFNLYDFTWHHNVQWCIEHGVRHYQVGQTDYADKVRLGGRLVPLVYFARHRQPVIHLVLRLLSKLINPATHSTAQAKAE